MPGGDRTGPAGQGSRTGRGAGYCNGYSTPGYANPGFGWGRGGGRGFRGGFGRGWGRQGYFGPGPVNTQPVYNVPVENPYVPPVPDRNTEMTVLRQQAEYLQAVLKDVQQRLSDLTDTDKE
jgi:Family of unknown function (DUF5320)